MSGASVDVLPQEGNHSSALLPSGVAATTHTGVQLQEVNLVGLSLGGRPCVGSYPCHV
jgi:hypothetical protein